MRYGLTRGTSLENADGTVVFLRESGDAAVLDVIGGVIAERLLGGDVDSCVACIVHDYDVESAEARKDIVGFKDELLSLDLIEELP